MSVRFSVITALRRLARLPAHAITLALLAGATAAAEIPLAPTVETHTGPWYAPGAPERASLWEPGDPGQALHLLGRVLDPRGAPLAGALVELWHTDGAGNYPPLRASLRTRDDGRFAIRTVLPGHHLGYRARHLRPAVRAVHLASAHRLVLREAVRRGLERRERIGGGAVVPGRGLTHDGAPVRITRG